MYAIKNVGGELRLIIPPGDTLLPKETRAGTRYFPLPDSPYLIKSAKKAKAAQEITNQMIAAIDKLPDYMHSTVREILLDRSMGSEVRMVMERWDEFSSPVAALLAGVGMNVEAKRHFDTKLDEHWLTPLSMQINESAVSIVGGGLHAAIFCAVRHRLGFPKPLVFEEDTRAGGVFATTTGPGFYLNSRNRPGRLSIPGDMEGSLNNLPGGIIQPSDISTDEYQTNDVMGWVIRCNLMMFANVRTQRSILDLKSLSASNVFLATGVGMRTPIRNPGKDVVRSARLLTFEKFLQQMEFRFPLRNVLRVAVLGTGDSGKCAIEALTGQGPMKLPGLDRPQIIDWYGVPTDRNTKSAWIKCNRSRYKGIGRLLPSYLGQKTTVTPYDKYDDCSAGYDTVYVQERPYDMVINCLPFVERPTPTTSGLLQAETRRIGIARAARATGRFRTLGPVAKIQPTANEQVALAGIEENATSIFLYGKKTAAVATGFPTGQEQ